MRRTASTAGKFWGRHGVALLILGLFCLGNPMGVSAAQKGPKNNKAKVTVCHLTSSKGVEPSQIQLDFHADQTIVQAEAEVTATLHLQTEKTFQALLELTALDLEKFPDASALVFQDTFPVKGGKKTTEIPVSFTPDTPGVVNLLARVVQPSQRLQVSPKALAAHLGHGDTLLDHDENDCPTKVLATAGIRFGVRDKDSPPGLPDDLLHVETVPLDAGQLKGLLDSGADTGNPVTLTLGSHTVTVRIGASDSASTIGGVVPAALIGGRVYQGIMTELNGIPLSHSSVVLTVWTNTVYGMLNQLKDPADFSSSLESIFVQPLFNPDGTLNGTTHMVYRNSDIVLDPPHLHPAPLIEPEALPVTGGKPTGGQVLAKARAPLPGKAEGQEGSPAPANPEKRVALPPSPQHLGHAIPVRWHPPAGTPWSLGAQSAFSRAAGAAQGYLRRVHFDPVTTDPAFYLGYATVFDHRDPALSATDNDNNTRERFTVFLEWEDVFSREFFNRRPWQGGGTNDPSVNPPRPITLGPIYLEKWETVTTEITLGDDCNTNLNSFRSYTQSSGTRNPQLNILFTRKGTNCGGIANLGQAFADSPDNPRPYECLTAAGRDRHAIVVQPSPVITLNSPLAKAVVTLGQEVGHNLNYHAKYENERPSTGSSTKFRILDQVGSNTCTTTSEDYDPHLDISEQWPPLEGCPPLLGWLCAVPNLFTHCTIMRGGYNGCAILEYRFHRNDHRVFGELSEGIRRFFIQD